MILGNNRHETVYKNLMEAGFDQEVIALCMPFAQQGKLSHVHAILKQHGSELAAPVHRIYRKICLDYRFHQMQTERARREYVA